MRPRVVTSEIDSWGARQLDSIRRANWILLVLLVSGSLFLHRPGFTRGVLVGAVLSTLNFAVAVRVLSPLAHGVSRAAPVAIIWVLKVLALMAAVAGLLLLGGVDALGFLVGLSVPVMSVNAVGVSFALRRPVMKSEVNDA